MPWLSRSLRNKLIAGSLLAVLALVLLPIFYAASAKEQTDTFGDIRHTYEVIDTAQSLVLNLRLAHAQELAGLLGGSPAAGDRFRSIRGELNLQASQLAKLVDDNPEQETRALALGRVIEDWLDSSPLLEPGAGEVARDPEVLERLVMGQHPAQALAVIFEQIDAFIEGEKTLLSERTERNVEARGRNMAVVLIGSAVAILTFLALSIWLTRSIVDPIRELTAATQRIQSGDLRARVQVRGRDELGQLGRGFNEMAASLQNYGRDLERRDIQAGVLQVAQVLAVSNDLPHLLDRALEQVLDVTHSPAGAIWIRPPGEDALRAMVAIGTGPGVLDSTVRPGEGVLGRVAQTRIAYFAPAESEAAPLTIQHWLGERRPAELAYVPLCSGPELVGILTLAAAEPLDERVRNLLRIVSGQLGAAIRDALSHQTLQRQTVELRASNDRLSEQQAEIERQNRELRVASQLKSEFLANMSHELRTPLTIVLGFTNTVLRGAQGPLTEPQSDSLRRVYDNAKHLLGLINDILDLSKIEAGQMEIEPEPFNLPGCLEAVGDNFRPMAEGKGLAFRVELDRDLPQQLVSDEIRVRQVVTNLASNAVKFTDRGEVTLAARRDGPDGVVVEVRDTGPGIAEEDIPKIFDQFRQLDGATTRRAGGTGLGLSIVRRLVELLGGRLEVRSRLGVGSTFEVHLPARLDEAKASPDVHAPDGAPTEPREGGTPARVRGQLVLAIDDDEDFLALLRAAFAGTPFALRCASSGQEGLELAQALRPDAITLDVMMPQMDGWRVLGALKSNPATAEIPVILLSVLQRRGLGLMLGASDYLTKPVDRDRLLAAIRQVSHARAGGTILVVDDDPDIRKMLDVELRSQGFTRIETAPDGVEGLRMARELSPDLVVLDLMMPRMDGFEMAARLQEDEATRGIPIIVLTAKDLTAADMARLNGQIEEIIQKGALNVDALIRRLVEILNGLGVKPIRGA
jgi:signal transduction histidine kinase/CheY-like chemotaxis protein